MSIYDVLTRLIEAKYSVLVISEAAKVPYMRVYRAAKHRARLTPEEEGKIKSFAFVQPVFTRGDSND